MHDVRFISSKIGRFVAVLAVVTAVWGSSGCSPCRQACEEEGKCEKRTVFSGDSRYRCYAASDEKCRQSEACAEEGRCHYEPAVETDECVALTVEDCMQSTGCREHGTCTPRRGVCVRTPVGCTRTLRCRSRGECHLVRENGSLVCGRSNSVPEDAFCRDACRKNGACTRRDNRCVATTEKDCQVSRGCQRRGECVLHEGTGTCVVSSDEDCMGESSREGHPAADVKVPDGHYCVPSKHPCREREVCEIRGWCALYKGLCRPGRDVHCRQSLNCELLGRCTLQNRLCRPTEPEDCAESLACRTAGSCSYRDEVGCYVADASDCRGSYGCRSFGRCEARQPDNCRPPHCERYCAAPGERPFAPCAETEVCPREGRCVLGAEPSAGRRYGPYNFEPDPAACVKRAEVLP